jgi:hypothetical protein
MPTSAARRGWDRYLPLSGAAFTALMVAGAAAFPMPPGGDVSPAAKPVWLAAHYNAVIAQSYVRALAGIAFIALGVAVAAAIRRAAGASLAGCALVGGTFSGGLVLLSQAVSVGAALFAHGGGNDDTTRALGSLQDAFLNLSSLPAVLLFGAAGAAALRTRLLPRWLTVVTLLGVPFALVDSASYDGGPFEPVGFIGLVYFLAWALVVGVQLFKAPRTTPDDAELPEPAFAV